MKRKLIFLEINKSICVLLKNLLILKSIHMAIKWRIVHASKVHIFNFNYRSKSMLISKSIIRFNKHIIKIPLETKALWDLSENRWGYRIGKK